MDTAGLRLLHPIRSCLDAQATPGGSSCLKRSPEMGLSLHPRPSGNGLLPQQFILRAAWLPSWNSLPSPQLSWGSITFALS